MVSRSIFPRQLHPWRTKVHLLNWSDWRVCSAIFWNPNTSSPGTQIKKKTNLSSFQVFLKKKVSCFETVPFVFPTLYTYWLQRFFFVNWGTHFRYHSSSPSVFANGSQGQNQVADDKATPPVVAGRLGLVSLGFSTGLCDGWMKCPQPGPTMDLPQKPCQHYWQIRSFRN